MNNNQSDLTIFENKTIGVDGLKYYVVPINYPLFKATKYIRKGEILQLNTSQHSFFGLKNMKPSYISEYEDEYGVLFEYKTTRVYNLIALDDSETVDLLYQTAPDNIKQILDENYGHHSGRRNSEPNNDRTLSQYLCSLNKDGYAVHNMMTESGGIFHTELMICNCSGIQYVGQITDEFRVEGVLESAKVKEMQKKMEEERKQAKKEARRKISEQTKMRLFGDDDEDDEIEKYNKPKSLFRFDENTPFRDDIQIKTPIRPLAISSAFQTPPKSSTKKRLFGMDDDDESENENKERSTPKKMSGRGKQHKSKTKKHKKHKKTKGNQKKKYTRKQKRKQINK